AAKKAVNEEMEQRSNCQELEVEHQKLQSENVQLRSLNHAAPRAAAQQAPTSS
ncbi:hypothetical protein MTO96_036552, partial [Rhipicephalus appendiculatus]